MKINTPWLADILTLRYSPTTKTGVPSVSFGDTMFGSGSFAQNTEKILKDNISDFINKNNPQRISLALSGGVDSILTFILIRELFPDLKIQCISFGFSPDDFDVKVASDIARRYDADFNSFLLDNFFTNLPKQISILGEPKINYYWYDVVEKAKHYSDVLVTGDGGDELFAGYTFRYKAYTEAFNSSFTWTDRVKLYLNCHNRDWVADQNEMFGPAVNFSWNSIYRHFRRFFDNGLPPLQQVWLADYNGKLAYDWIPAHEKIHKTVGVTKFTPFLSKSLILYAFSIPVNKKYDYNSNLGKIPLRDILNTKGCSVDFGKKGFGPDLPSFWQEFGRGYVMQFLIKDSRVVSQGLISEKWVLHALDIVDKTSDIRYMNRLLHLISLEIWYRLFVTGEMSSSDTL